MRSPNIIRIAGILALLILVLILVLLLNLESEPEIHSLSPRIGAPGEIMVLEGRHFGTEPGAVYIAGQRITSSAILEWGGERISLRIPGGTNSGLVIVETASGQSRGILYAQQSQVPIPVRPQEGSQLAGLELDRNQLRRGQDFELRSELIGSHQGANRLLWRNLDGYEAEVSIGQWGVGKIQGKVPGFATDGWLVYRSADGQEELLEVFLPQVAGLASNEDLDLEKRIWEIEYGLNILLDEAEASGSRVPSSALLSLAIPLPQELPSQRILDIQLSAQPKDGFMRGNLVLDGSQLDMQQGLRARVETGEQRFRITESQLASSYQGFEEIASPWLDAQSPILDLDNDEAGAIRRRAASILGAQRNHMRKIHLLYAWLLDRLEPSGLQDFPHAADVFQAVEEASATSPFSTSPWGYVSLFAAMFRSAELPSRMVQGFLFLSEEEVRAHFWLEVLLPEIGWIPLDPYLADGAYGDRALKPLTDMEDRAYYLAGLDAYRISLGPLSALPDLPGSRLNLVDPPLGLHPAYIDLALLGQLPVQVKAYLSLPEALEADSGER